MKPWVHHVTGSVSCDPCPAAAAWEVIPYPRGRCKLLHVLFVAGRWHGHPAHEKRAAAAVIVAVENRAAATLTAVVSVSVFVSLEAAGRVAHWVSWALGQLESSKVRVWPRVFGERHNLHCDSCAADLAQPQMFGHMPRRH